MAVHRNRPPFGLPVPHLDPKFGIGWLTLQLTVLIVGNYRNDRLYLEPVENMLDTRPSSRRIK
jgi:hypothetical protein